MGIEGVTTRNNDRLQPEEPGTTSSPAWSPRTRSLLALLGVFVPALLLRIVTHRETWGFGEVYPLFVVGYLILVVAYFLFRPVYERWRLRAIDRAADKAVAEFDRGEERRRVSTRGRTDVA